MTEQPRATKRILKFVLFVCILAVCWFLGRIFKVDVEYYQGFLLKYPLMLSGLIFVVLYVVTTTFVWFGPKDVLRISSAILFGGYVSTVFVWTGEMVNAAIMFSLSRTLGQEYVQERFKVSSGDLERMKEDASLLGVAAWRINPLVPFRLMDLGYGLTTVPLRKYLLAIVVVSFFRILWLQFILEGVGVSLFKDIPAVLDYFVDHPRVLRYSGMYFLAVVVLTIIAIAVRISRKRKKG